jgi:tetratricopeptide (TPR) repeat protein
MKVLFLSWRFLLIVAFLTAFLGPSCALWRKDSLENHAFYYDEMEVEGLVREGDSPQRKASLRQIAKTLSAQRQGVKGVDVLSELEKALRIDPYNPYAYYFLSTNQLAQERFQNAEAMAKRAAALWREDPSWQAKALVLQAKANEALHQDQLALNLYERAYQLDPRNPLAQKGLKKLDS